MHLEGSHQLAASPEAVWKLLNDPDVIEARFGKVVDIIVDGGIIVSDPSTVVDLTGDEPVVLRAGEGHSALFK